MQPHDLVFTLTRAKLGHQVLRNHDRRLAAEHRPRDAEGPAQKVPLTGGTNKNVGGEESDRSAQGPCAADTLASREVDLVSLPHTVGGGPSLSLWLTPYKNPLTRATHERGC